MAKGKPSIHICPNCGNRISYTSWEYINNRQDAVLLSKIEDLTLFENYCTQCGTALYPEMCLLYQDMDNKFIIYYVEGSEEKIAEIAESIENNHMEGYTYRIVNDKVDLAEKIDMINSGYNEIVLMLAKWMVLYTGCTMAKAEGGPMPELIFFEFNEGKPVFRMTYPEDMMRIMEVTSEMYAEMTEMFWDIAEAYRNYLFVTNEWASDIIITAMNEIEE